MSRAPVRVAAKHLIVRAFIDVYLSLFVLFYRISRWKGRLKASSASLGMMIVEILLAGAIWMWIQMATGRYIELNPWAVIACAVLILAPSDYFLVVRGHGPAFERQFRQLARSKQIALYVVAMSVAVATLVAFFLTIPAYHQVFNLTRK